MIAPRLITTTVLINWLRTDTTVIGPSYSNEQSRKCPRRNAYRLSDVVNASPSFPLPKCVKLRAEISPPKYYENKNSSAIGKYARM